MCIRDRLAPSTMAIIWSRKLCPASCVTRTTSQSDSTVVPPVILLDEPLTSFDVVVAL